MKKNKKIIIGAISALAIVSVSAIGFSSWIVGVQDKDTEATITAEVDDTSNDSLLVSASIASDTNLVLAEKQAYTREEGIDIIGAGKGQGDVLVSANALSFTFENIQVIVGDGSTKPTGVTLSFDENAHEFINTESDKLGSVNEKDLRPGIRWSYIAFDDVTIPWSDFEKDTSKSVEGSYEVFNLSASKKTYSFSWGTYFGNEDATLDGNQSPVTYYNNLLKEAKEDPEEGYKLKDGITALDLVNTANNAGVELKDMATAFASKTLTIKVTLNEASAG